MQHRFSPGSYGCSDAVEPVTDSLREALSVDHPADTTKRVLGVGSGLVPTLDQNCKLFEETESKTYRQQQPLD